MNAILNKVRYFILKLFLKHINNEINIITMNQRIINQMNKLGMLITKCSGISLEDLVAKKKLRKQEYVKARQVHMVCLKLAFNLSYEKASRMYYEKDHTTAMHSVVAVNDELDTNKDFREQYREVFWYAYSINPKMVSKVLHIDWLIKP